MSLAAVVSGAYGLIVEGHDHPEKALCDIDQTLTLEQFLEMCQKVRALRRFMENMN